MVGSGGGTIISKVERQKNNQISKINDSFFPIMDSTSKISFWVVMPG